MKIRSSCVALSASLILLIGHVARAQQIAGGEWHALAICADGTPMSWGRNVYGQLGDGADYTNATTPVQVNGLPSVISVSGGTFHSLFLDEDGNVWACGANFHGQLGDGTVVNHDAPTQVSGLTNIIGISAGNEHCLALRNDSTVWSWGWNLSGQLGDGTFAQRNMPVQVLSLSGVIAVAAGYEHSLALKGDGTLWAWGRNNAGQLGDATTLTRNVPVQVSPLFSGDVSAIAAGQYHSLALTNAGAVWSWGSNYLGQLGDGTNTNRHSPVPVVGLSDVTSLAQIGLGLHSMALKMDGTVWAWGASGANGSLATLTTPTLIPSLTDITAIAGGEDFSIALASDGTLRTWGYNWQGQLGNGIIGGVDVVPDPVIGLCSVATTLEEHGTGGSIAVFPNPTTGMFAIEGLNKSSPSYLEIRNAIGQEVLRTTFNGARSEIDLSSQPSGVYLLIIRSVDPIITRTLIKQ